MPKQRPVCEVIGTLRRLIQREVAGRHTRLDRSDDPKHAENDRPERELPRRLPGRPQHERDRDDPNNRTDEAGTREREDVGHARKHEHRDQYTVAMNEAAREEHRDRDVEIAGELIRAFQRTGDARKRMMITEEDPVVRADEVLGQRGKANENDADLERAPKRPVVRIGRIRDRRAEKEHQVLRTLEPFPDDCAGIQRVRGAEPDRDEDEREAKQHRAHRKRP